MLKYLRKSSRILFLGFAFLMAISACATTKEEKKTVAKPTKSEEVPTEAESGVAVGAVGGGAAGAVKAGEEKPYVVQLRDEERAETERRTAHENLFSLHFKEISLDAVISMLSDRGKNFHYVIHPDVGERRVLGLVLENVTWREALEIIAKLHNLVIIDERNLIVINTYDNYMSGQEQEAKRIKLFQDRAEMERSTLAASLKSKEMAEDDRRLYKSFHLKYTSPNEVMSFLCGLFGGGGGTNVSAGATGTQGGSGESKIDTGSARSFQDEGKVSGAQCGEAPQGRTGKAGEGSAGGGDSKSRITFSTFTKANILTAYGVPKDIDEVTRRISEIDVPQQQIFIESRIVEIARSYSRSLGVQWGGSVNTATGMAFPATAGVAGTSQAAAATATATATAGGTTGAVTSGMGATNSMVNFPATDPTSGSAIPAAVSVAISDVAGTAALNMRLSALEIEGKSKTLSNPKITTINGMMATVQSGREIPYQQSAGGGAGATTVAFKQAVIAMVVTPFITPDNKISLKIIAKKDDADFSNQVLNTPSILTRLVETSVMVSDGGTAVLGGVFENLQANTDKGVPFMSKIPIVGWLFKGSEKLDNEKELLIFITPKIVRGTYS